MDWTRTSILEDVNSLMASNALGTRSDWRAPKTSIFVLSVGSTGLRSPRASPRVA